MFLLDVVKLTEIRSGVSVCIAKGLFFPDKTGLCALSELQKDQTDRSVGFVSQETQSFGFQSMGVSADHQFRKPLRAVD